MTMTTLKAMALSVTFTIASGNVHSSQNASQCVYDFSEQQLNTLATAYHIGKTQDLGYTLAAISWRESRAGEDVVSMRYGLKAANMGAFQNKVKTVSDREGCKNRKCYANVAIKLLTDQEYAAQAALDEMQFWLSYHKQNVRKSLSSYNAGFARNSASNAYAADVVKKAKYLQKCVSFKGRTISEVDPQVIAMNKRTIEKLKRTR
ncbi:endoribonuclease RegB family protein [Dickeya phage Coodle]|uniref:Endoribonuclease RegB family protein n=1 Tax=Dickeya phage Coodle TaxID=2320188 RepID=A0A3G2K911_9CAUD|nr:endoribonuclease RegB family protein [Dickeya phage Coodle]